MTASTSKYHDKGEMTPLSIVYLPVSSLKTASRQTRKHSKKQLTKLAASITAFGFVMPVIVDETATILNGHACVEAAKMIGLTEVPAVSVAHLSPEKKRALAIALDRLAELGEWDDELLRLELAELSELDLDFSLELTGFDTAEIDLMLDTSGKNGDDEVEEIDEEPTKVAISQLGDLWLLGKHKVLCGRCHDPVSWERLMGGDQARMVFTDPPFNCTVNGHVSGLGKHKHREFAEGSGGRCQSKLPRGG